MQLTKHRAWRIFFGINIIAVSAIIFTEGSLYMRCRTMFECTDRNTRSNETLVTDKIKDLIATNGTSSLQLKTLNSVTLQQSDTRTQSRHIEEHIDIINKRKEIVSIKCAKQVNLPLQISGILYSIPDKINFCEIPKAGCTYWKSVLRFVAGDYPKNSNISNPSEIDRMYVHFGKWKNVKRYNGQKFISSTETLRNAKNVMFVREPYGRLWSAYLDKFYLPDFWCSFGPKFRETNQRNCVNDITFQEFLTQILKSSDKRYRDKHWEPFYRLCNPCKITYDVIGKVETFSKDSKFILNSLGIGNTIRNSYAGANSLAKKEIMMLTKYNFSFKNDSCYNYKLIAKRLWSVFQMNGYIFRNFTYPVEMFDDSTANTTDSSIIPVFKQYVLNILNKQNYLAFNYSYQKYKYMIDAYKSIPMKLLYKIQAFYKYDFELFGYESEPTEIFSR